MEAVQETLVVAKLLWIKNLASTDYMLSKNELKIEAAVSTK